MKEASGELNMTLITIVAIAALAAIMAAFWPNIKKTINDKWGQTTKDAGKIGIVLR